MVDKNSCRQINFISQIRNLIILPMTLIKAIENIKNSIESQLQDRV